jgi:hypothetical protein
VSINFPEMVFKKHTSKSSVKEYYTSTPISSTMVFEMQHKNIVDNRENDHRNLKILQSDTDVTGQNKLCCGHNNMTIVHPLGNKFWQNFNRFSNEQSKLPTRHFKLREK